MMHVWQALTCRRAFSQVRFGPQRRPRAQDGQPGPCLRPDRCGPCVRRRHRVVRQGVQLPLAHLHPHHQARLRVHGELPSTKGCGGAVEECRAIPALLARRPVPERRRAGGTVSVLLWKRAVLLELGAWRRAALQLGPESREPRGAPEDVPGRGDYGGCRF